jgi:hypothetical protein
MERIYHISLDELRVLAAEDDRDDVLLWLETASDRVGARRQERSMEPISTPAGDLYPGSHYLITVKEGISDKTKTFRDVRIVANPKGSDISQDRFIWFNAQDTALRNQSIDVRQVVAVKYLR